MASEKKEDCLVSAINYLLDITGINFSLTALEEVSESIFVVLLEHLREETIPDIRRDVNSHSDHIHNAQVFITFLGQTYFQSELSHIAADDLARGEYSAVCWVTEIIFELFRNFQSQGNAPAMPSFATFCPDDAARSTPAHSGPPTPRGVEGVGSPQPVPIGGLSGVLPRPPQTEEPSQRKRRKVRAKATLSSKAATRARPVQAAPAPERSPRLNFVDSPPRPQGTTRDFTALTPDRPGPTGGARAEIDFALSQLMQRQTQAVRRRRERLEMGRPELRTAMLRETLAGTQEAGDALMGPALGRTKTKARGRYQQMVMEYLRAAPDVTPPGPGGPSARHVRSQERAVEMEVTRLQRQTEARRAQTEEKVFRELYTGALSMERRHLQAEEKLRREVAVKQRDIERAAEKAMECQYEGRIGLLKEEIGRLRTGQKKEATSVRDAMKHVTREADARHRATVKDLMGQLRQLHLIEQGTARHRPEALAEYVMATIRGDG